ncbi:MAG: 5-deoxy-glucuronate isomerase [Planctomycetes bacterium]|nr:5-deoxy-glucuronate isomerase [Planctomycetota bacterium]
MNFHVAKPVQLGFTPIVAPGQSGTQFITLGLITLQAGKQYCFNTADEEKVGVILGGECDVRGDDFGWRHAGGRQDVFHGKAAAFYLPPSVDCRITARTPLSLALAGAKTNIEAQPVFIEPHDVGVRDVGKANYRRQVHDIFDDRHHAGRLIVGETFNPPGNWSSYPPHRHENDNPPEETKQEEVYFFKFRPRRGFGWQRIYTDDGRIDESYCVQDGSAVIIPRGYHPVAAAPGYELYYLWILAGETRSLHPHDDPEHQWISQEQ